MPNFLPKIKTKKKVITFADAQFWDMKILGGMLPDYTSLHGFAPMVMKRFQIIEKLYLSKALLKMAGGGMHPPHPPLDPRLASSNRNLSGSKNRF